MKNKIITSLVALSFLALPVVALGASVTIDTIPTVCSSVVIRGTASYTAPDTLHIALNGTEIASFVSGDTTFQVTANSGLKGTNDVSVTVSSTTVGVIATATASFATSCGNQNPDFVTQAWGLTGFNTPKVKFGTVVFDEIYFTDTCTYFWGCFDIHKTAYYRLPVLKLLGQ